MHRNPSEKVSGLRHNVSERIYFVDRLLHTSEGVAGACDPLREYADVDLSSVWQHHRIVAAGLLRKGLRTFFLFLRGKFNF